nr:hypothetical protein [Bacillus sp. Marseille-P3661]
MRGPMVGANPYYGRHDERFLGAPFLGGLLGGFLGGTLMSPYFYGPRPYPGYYYGPPYGGYGGYGGYPYPPYKGYW